MYRLDLYLTNYGHISSKMICFLNMYDIITLTIILLLTIICVFIIKVINHKSNSIFSKLDQYQHLTDIDEKDEITMYNTGVILGWNVTLYHNNLVGNTTIYSPNVFQFIQVYKEKNSTRPVQKVVMSPIFEYKLIE